MKTQISHPTTALIAVVCVLVISLPAVGYAADSIDQSRKIINQTNQQLEGSQNKINTLHDATTSMVDQYKTATRESETYTTYNLQLSEIIKSQTEELTSLNAQIEEIEVTSKQIMPLMGRMINTLKQFITQDLPFLPEERTDRVTKLQNNMKRADLSVAEKYRKILEAYQVEIEYGKTLEAYEGKLKEKKVNFLKIGRTAFFYQTMDASQCAIWNKHKGDWQEVEDSEIKNSVSIAMKVARKQQSPELLTILASKVEVSK